MRVCACVRACVCVATGNRYAWRYNEKLNYNEKYNEKLTGSAKKINAYRMRMASFHVEIWVGGVLKSTV
jgi:hypothetical protein